MTDFIPRTCTEVGEDGNVRKNADGSERTFLPFEEFRGADAYVLLGAPGAGKTTAFKQEAHYSEACLVTARNFVTFDDRLEWHDTTLFIDGLDEMRAGSSDGRTPLDGIRKKIEQLGRPRFRLSCREADWFGANDREHLKTVSRNGQVTVLRLDPLTDENIHKILRDNREIDDPETFIDQARQNGLESLLTNPQSLKMLVDAVGAGTWPDTRKKTYELACRKLVSEHNEEHRIANADTFSADKQLDGAGRLCATLLLTGHAGYALTGDTGNGEYCSLKTVPFDDPNIASNVVRTKLFGAPSEGRATPVHRHVAEFLGGRYLAGLVDNGLPIRRILALMTGDDGGVVSEIRGLSAWFAAHNKTSRTAIIERDPLGTVLYGDVRDFSFDEKRRLIEILKQEAQRNQEFFEALAKMDSRFGDLATPDMEPVFREVLTSPTRDDTHQALVVVLVEALRHGPAIPKLTDVLLGVVRDDSWGLRIRYRALDTILHQSKNDKLTDAALMKLLADVNDGSVPDSDDELLGCLLHGLYPSKLSALEILQYLRIPKHRDLFGMYKLFWNGKVPTDSTNAQRAELLDILIERSDELLEKIQEDPTDKRNLIYHLPSNLLVSFLETSQEEEIASGRLFSWLSVAAWNYRERWVLPGGAEGIRAWLTNHPETQKAMIAACVEDCRVVQRFDLCVSIKYRRLFNATPPPDFGSWCLKQAIHATDDDAAIWYIREVADAVHWHEERLTREIVKERLAKHPSLEQAFRKRLSEREEHNNTTTRAREEDKKPKSREHQKFLNQVKEHLSALRENQCSPALLNYLAAAYFDGPIDRLFEGSTPKDRLHNLLGGDTDLIETVLTAFRDSINRNDVPGDAEIIRLRAGDQRHLLQFPFLAGVEELSKPEKEPPFNERQMRQAIAFYYNSGALPYYRRSEKPHWYRWLLDHRPDVVSDVLIEFARSEIRGGKEHCSEAHKLAFSKKHEVVARLASLPLLKLFPVRCTSTQLRSLNVLLIAALLHCEKGSFEKLIERKLSFPSMNVAQRVYWLAAGFLASPASYREKLRESVAGRDRRIRRLAEFLTRYHEQSVGSTLFEHLNAQELALLIQLIGGSYRPSAFSDFPSDPQESALGVWLIQRLASLPSRDATEALDSLSSDNALQPWQFQLDTASYRQNQIRREAGFRHKDISQVLQVLDNLTPANAADLAALTTDILSGMARRIREENTSDWRQYWNVDSHNRPESQKPEPGCRDALLSDLRLKLERVEGNVKIDAQPEGHYADDARSDVRVSFNGFNVPVEIKKNNHPDLWSAIKDQLIRKYTRDPGADGYGIYLVLWFGAEECRMPPSGKRPTSALELQERLLDTLSADEKSKISICVIDVSKP